MTTDKLQAPSLTMGPLFQRYGRRFAAMIIVVPLLSGCIRGLIEGKSNILRPDIIKVTVPTDTPKPPAKGLCPEPEGTGKQAGKQEQPQQPCPPVEQKLLPQQLPPRTPEQLMPILPPVPPKTPEQPQGNVTEPPRRLAAAPSPDALYGDAVLNEDVTWRGEVLVSGVVTVAPQATLTVEPGTTVRFDGSAGLSAGRALLLVHGRLVASGTREKPVLFTSRFAEPMRGDWQGIVMLGSEKRNLLENCRLEGAETGLDASFSTITLKSVFFDRCTTGARLLDTVVTATGGGASGCDLGMSLADSEADLRDPVFSGNRSGMVVERSSLYLAGGVVTGHRLTGIRAVDSRLKIAAAAFTANGAGLDLAASQGSVAGCRIAENIEYGIALAGSRVKMYGNDIARNGKTGMRVEDGGGAAWGNSFAANGEYDLAYAGRDDFRAIGNWWGGALPAEVGKRISPQTESGGGKVLYLPVLTARPATIP